MLKEDEIRKEVIGGKDGYLFLHGGAAHQFAYLSGQKKVNRQSIKNMQANTQRRITESRRFDATYLNVIMPSKPVICADKLPAEYQGKCRSVYLTSFQPALDPVCSAVTLYPADAMGGSDTFKKIDSHPNDLGNLKAAGAILSALGVEMVDAPQLETRPNPGDLAVMIGHKDMRSYEPTFVRPMKNLCNFDNKSLLPPGTNTGHIRILFNPKDMTRRTLLICGDSFTVGMLPVFARCFETVIYVRGPLFPYELLRSFAPSHVVSSSTERYIVNQIDDCGKPSPVTSNKSAEWYTASNAVIQAMTVVFERAADEGRYSQWKEDCATSLDRQNSK